MRFIARYGIDNGDSLEIKTVFDERIESEVVAYDGGSVQSIATTYPVANWFERKIRDDFGIEFDNAFDTRPLNHHERFPDIAPMKKSFTDNEITEVEFRPYPYEVIDGDSVFEVSVGPIHAGIIEPGHFHFSQAGEAMLHQEVRHFYTYRGIEKSLEGKSLTETLPIIERISGNETIAYQIALRDILSQASATEVSQSHQKRDALVLELERIIHHLTDLGFIPNDAGFGAALAFCSKLTEDSRRLMKDITGHRFGFGYIFSDKKAIERAVFEKYIATMKKEIAFFRDWILDIPSLWDRFDTTGILPLEKAEKYSTVGVVARASGVEVDTRLGKELYRNAGFSISTEKAGDVGARFLVRLQEVEESLRLMEAFYEEGSLEKIRWDRVKDGEYHSFVESSIGELFFAVTIKNSSIDRFFIRDASFINWQAMHITMPNNIIPDFPLINKSFDLSYAGSDL